MISIGIPESSLKMQHDYYKDGYPVTITAETSDADTKELTGGAYTTTEDYLKAGKTDDVAWLQLAYDELSQGVNHAISINVTGNGAASLTTMVNGQPTASYNGHIDVNGKLFQSADYFYVNGFLDKVEQYNWEVKYVNKNKQENIDVYENALKVYFAATPNGTKEEFDSKNASLKTNYDAAINDKSTEVKYEKSTTTIQYNAYGQQDYITNNAGDTIMKYNYAVNGSLAYTSDLQNNVTTNYTNGKPTEIINSAGYVSAKYNYLANGSLDNVVSYNNGVATRMTVYANGKELLTVDLSQGTLTADQARNAYRELITPGKTTEQIYGLLEQNHIVSVQIYTENLLNMNLMKVLFAGFNDANLKKHLDFMRVNSDGYSAVGSAQFVWGGGVDEYSFDGKKFATEAELKEAIVDSIRKTSKKYEQVVDKNGNRLLDDSGNWKAGKSAADMDVDASTTYDQNTHGVTKTTTARTITSNVTLNVNGAASYTVNGIAQERTKGSTTAYGGFYDPAVTGVGNGFVDADGNKIEDIDKYLAENPDADVYIAVSADGINMFDGSVWHDITAKDGEEIYVKINPETDSDLISAVKNNERVAVFGNVGASVDGHLTMSLDDTGVYQTDSSDGKSYVTGSGVANVRAEIETLAQTPGSWVYNNIETNKSVLGGLTVNDFSFDNILDSIGAIWDALLQGGGK